MSLHEHSEVLERVKIFEEFRDVVGDFSLARVLDFQFLLVKLAQTIHTLVHIIIVEEGPGVVIWGELDQENGVPFVLAG